jgi:predicted dehydrogenase
VKGPRRTGVRVGLVGSAFMGRAHSFAWANVASVFGEVSRPELVAVCSRDRGRAAELAGRYGWGESEEDWRRLVERADIDLIDVCTPGALHKEISVAALQAGKHVLCEKPLANGLTEAVAMVAAAQEAWEAVGAQAVVGFNVRRFPAIRLAKDVLSGAGTLRHVRASYLQDWLVDPEFPMTWRLDRSQAGSGALGDLASHLIDLAQYITGQQIFEVSSLMQTFVAQRHVAAASSGLSATSGADLGHVTVDDAVAFVSRFADGPVGAFEATRFATGHRNSLRIEVNADDATVGFDIERPNELVVYRPDGGLEGFRCVNVTEGAHAYMQAWWPPGHVLGWDHSFIHQARDLLIGIVEGEKVRPDFADGLQVQRVLDAVERSARAKQWQTVQESEPSYGNHVLND